MRICRLRSWGSCALLAVFLAGCARQAADSVNCANAITSISLAGRLWAEEHGEKGPANFLCLSNELVAPGILRCPADHKRQKATSWAAFTATNCSYELVAPELRITDTNRVFIRCLVHGHRGYLDGTVFDGVRRRTKHG